MTIPPAISEIFYRAIKGYLPILDFEQWIYNCDHTERYFWPDDRLILLSLDYNSGHAPYEVRRILFKYISEAEMETWNLLYLLTEAKKKDERLPAILMEFYDLYFGYDFMQDLALSYGLRVEVPYANESWNDLSPSEQQQMLVSMEPGLSKAIDQMIGWISSGQIKLTGEKNGNNRYAGYIDNRVED